MSDALSRFLVATHECDIAGMVRELAPDAELRSPLFGGMTFRGRDDVGVVLGTVYRILRDPRWEQPIGTGSHRAVVGTARLGRAELTDALIVDLDEQDRITRLRPHLRPLPATTWFMLRLGPALARNPGVLRRAGGGARTA
ncbi:nuclear transport factor 2 family protein [Nocardia sp. CC227C]|uniref:nuclear transport factor 2 family protein n=1 Tax=Nocardia sp. CC227C TaxID=3044562 RepID=UPI00278BBAFF|nr:nuclear transport factor 2 family protein [Nocardia sp. CC227C]